MDIVQTRRTDDMNNDVSSTSSDDPDPINKFNNFYKSQYANNAASDNEVCSTHPHPKQQSGL